jgi:uncharacterized surface protein with fasciclin (FAS1) repeats
MKSGLLHIILLFVAVFAVHSCRDIEELDKYKAPEWLSGKLFSQIAEQEQLSTFAECLRITGFDTLINLSGSYTVFAPSNEAFNEYFSNHPELQNDMGNMPIGLLNDFVRFHIIQDSWNKAQLQTLDIEGWIDPDNKDSKARAFKRQTLLREPNNKYWVDISKSHVSIVDSTDTDESRIAFTSSRKFVPIFFDDFFRIHSLETADYEYYFERPYEPGNLYYAGAKLEDEEIFAENGFVYIIDKVIEPFLNAEQFLKKEYAGNESYQSVLDLIYLFPSFEFNRDETNNQPAAREGKLYDSIYNLTFPDLLFNIHEERTGPNTTVSKYTYAYHNALIVPTDDAFQRFLDEVVTVNSGLPHWSGFNAVPREIKQIITNTYLFNGVVYQSDILKGITKDDGSVLYIDPATVIRKEYGSNCTFIGLNQAVIPRVFSSVTGPVYLRPGYSMFMRAMQLTKVLPVITRQDADYSLYIIPDAKLYEDSSLLINWIDYDENRYNFKSFNRSSERMYNQSTSELAKRLLNQVGISQPSYRANKEFIETLGGNYIVWDHSQQKVSGAQSTVFGFRGDSIIDLTWNELEEPADNGITYEMGGWFRHSFTDMYGRLSGYPYFKELLTKAGLYNPSTYQFTFLTEGEFYTVFIPTEEALLLAGADTLEKKELANLLKYHFVRGVKIFTDGQESWADYETLRVDESSTGFSTNYSTLNIKPSPDVIEILDSDGNPYVTIHEDAETTNIMIATDTDKGGSSDTDFITTGIIHVIDKVLKKY